MILCVFFFYVSENIVSELEAVVISLGDYYGVIMALLWHCYRTKDIQVGKEDTMIQKRDLDSWTEDSPNLNLGSLGF